MRHSPSRVFPFLAATVIVQGCDDGLRPVTPNLTMSAATEPLVARLVARGVTDPDIDWVPAVTPQFSHHYVWLDASRPSIGKLFVFLPGVGPQSPRPRVYQFVKQEAARLGYHVIGLMYPTNVGAGICTGGPDPNCYENVRLEIIDGVDRSGLVDVNRANSIENRLATLLLYRDGQFPDQGWSKFLHKGEPKWSQIAVGGHSGGAGQAAIIGKIRHVDRVVTPPPRPLRTGDFPERQRL